MPGVCAGFFDMLEVQHQSKWHLISDAEQAQDVKLVCSILASSLYIEVDDLPKLYLKTTAGLVKYWNPSLHSANGTALNWMAKLLNVSQGLGLNTCLM
jgi:hypothetical protein